MQNTPVANRLHIGIFGRRNVGKSSFIALSRFVQVVFFVIIAVASANLKIGLRIPRILI
jgi:hypothetical protein